MNPDEPSIETAGESALMLRWPQPPGPALTGRILGLAKALRDRIPAVVDAVPGYTTLTLHLSQDADADQSVRAQLATLLPTIPVTAPSPRRITLPVWYDSSVGPDLEALARRAGLSVSDCIALHTQTRYFAYATGFAPGFCYLGEVDARLAVPRLATPRREVPAGSVAIADRQTAVYPRRSPGGWHLIGRCPTVLFDVDANPPNTLEVGDEVQFEAIDRDRFLALGGIL